MVKLAGLRHKRWLIGSSFSTRVTVGTHDGTFHCDEALACSLLLLSKRFSAAHIVRTRDPNLLQSLHALVDVGGLYDPQRHRFDHHQKDFHQVFAHSFATKLSSAGLVYKHFGLEIIANVLGLHQAHSHVRHLYPVIYRNFVEAIDAADNGVNQYDLDFPPKYEINTTLSSRIKRLNLNWMDSDHSPERENQAFRQAMELAGAEFLDNVKYYAKSSSLIDLVLGNFSYMSLRRNWKSILLSNMFFTRMIEVRIGDCRQWQFRLLDLRAENRCHFCGGVWKMISSLRLLESQVVLLCT